MLISIALSYAFFYFIFFLQMSIWCFSKLQGRIVYTITKVLRVYENAMGQMINLDKSPFSLISKNINEKNDI